MTTVGNGRVLGSDPKSRRSHAARRASTDGYFAPDSIIRRMGSTPLTPFLGGGPAVLLQVAHPLVAAGVAQHSGYGHGIWPRLVGTLRALYAIAFGTKAEADRAGENVQRVHARIHGVTETQLGRYPAGTAYSARDSDLLLWVHATLVHSSLEVYHRFVHPLSVADQERYYDEMTVMARIFGVPADVIPPTLVDFREYFAAQLAGDTLAVTEPARQVAAAVLGAEVPIPLRVFVPAHRLATAFVLPQHLRVGYGLRWTARRDRALVHSARVLRYATVPVTAAASRVPVSGFS
jgi:uncharacterized protein (DUF2236 family)